MSYIVNPTTEQEPIQAYSLENETIETELLGYKINTYIKCMDMTFPHPNTDNEASIWTAGEMADMKRELRLMMKELSGYETSRAAIS